MSVAAAKSPKKVTKPKKPAAHPKYAEMVAQAISGLKERGGSSRQAILKYIMKNFNVGNDEKVVNTHLKVSLRTGVKNSNLKQSKGTGASGSFRIGEAAKKVVKPKKVKKPKAAAKKPAAKPKKDAKKVKKAPAKKAPAKKTKAAAPKKAKAAPKTKKAAKSPKTVKPKKASKPKKAAKKTTTKKA